MTAPSRWLDELSRALGRPAGTLAAILTALGALSLAAGLGFGRAIPLFAAVTAAWLFCAGLAAGGVALSAAVRLTGGRWAGGILPIADASIGFFVPALLLLALLLIGAPSYIPWVSGATTGHHGLMVLRQLAPTALLFTVGWRYTALARQGVAAARRTAAVYLLLYAVVLSLWAYDFVMELRSGPPSTVIPVYYLLGSFLSALAWAGLVAAARDTSGPALRHDVGKLLFALIIVWSYLLWAVFLPTWYGNIPEEVAPLLLRWRGPYRPLTVAVLFAVFLWPFWLFFSEKLKRRRFTLGLGAGAILCGLLGERFLLVLPSLAPTGGALSFAVGGGAALGVIGLFLVSVGPRMPHAEDALARDQVRR